MGFLIVSNSERCSFVVVSRYSDTLNMVLFNTKSTDRFLAHLAKGNVNFCHHLASVVR